MLDWLRASAAALIGSALLGRLLYHRRLVAKGERRFWSWELAWEAPAVVFLALLAAALQDYLDLTTVQACGVSAVLGWLGPRGIEVVLARHFGERQRDSK